VIAQLSYNIEYARRHMATQVSLFYEGQRAGSYSYMYDGDMNNDGYNYDLIYVPALRDELNFADKKVGETTFTAEEQRDAFWNFVNQDPYLSKRKGKYAEAYGAYLPWYNRFDLRVAQSFKLRIGRQLHSLTLSVDILNIGNLLNDKWGVTKDTSPSNGARVLKLVGTTDSGEPIYNLSTIKEDGKTVLISKSFADSRTSDNCWQMQFGVRYTF